MKIDLDGVEKSDYTLDDVLTLTKVARGNKGLPMSYSGDTEATYVSLIDKGLLAVTETGLVNVAKDTKVLNKLIIAGPAIKKATLDQLFGEFWTAYPASDAHGSWSRTRTLKSNRISCRNLYDKALKSGVEHQDIMDSLKWEVSDKRQQSVTDNRMKFMKNSATWLYQKEYEIIKEIRGDSQVDDSDGDWTEQTV